MGNMDDKLMAYLDGELDAESRAALEEELSASPELALRLSKLKAGDAHLEAFMAADTFSDIRPDTAALAAQLAEKLERQSAGEAGDAHEQPEAQVIAFTPRQGEAGSPVRRFIPHAIAASVALIVGFGAGVMSPAQNGTSGSEDDRYLAGILEPGSGLYSALETQPSEAYPATASAETRMVPLTSFKARDGSYCREYAVTSPAGDTRGLACKAGDTWRIQASVAVATRAAASGDFSPASDMGESPIDALIMSMMAGDAFSADEETQAIKGGWK